MECRHHPAFFVGHATEAETHLYSGQGPGKHQIVEVPEMPNAKNFVRQLGQSSPKGISNFSRIVALNASVLCPSGTVSSAADFASSLAPDGKTFTIQGKLEYQACDSESCFLPTSVPIQWQFRPLPLDRRRAPQEIQHK